MSIKEQIKTEMVSAMKAKDQVRLITLRSISTALTNAEKSGNGTVDEISILKTLAKQRNQAIDAYTQAGNTELADNEKAELKVIETFLPKGMTADEIRNIVSTLIPEGFNQKQMGMVMGQFNKSYPGQDGKLVSEIVKSFLS